MNKQTNTENEYVSNLIAMEDLAEKKTKIYSRLFFNPRLAGRMEELSAEHAKRKAALQALLYGKDCKEEKKANGRGRCATNGQEGEE